MKLRSVFIFLACLVSGDAISSQYSKVLAKTEVSHLALIANNLNMFYLLNDDFEKSNEESDHLRETLVRFSVSKDKMLLIESHYIGPVSEVTTEGCKNAISEVENNIKGADSKIYSNLRMFSVLNITSKQSESVFDSAQIAVTLRAQENKELSVSCKN